MKRNFLKILTIILLFIIIMISSFISPSKVNATNITYNEKRIICPDIKIGDIPISHLEEKIVEYDATTGITKEVDMNTLRKSIILKSIKNGGVYDRIEPYDPLNNNTVNTISPYSLVNPVSDTSSLPYRAICRIKGKYSIFELDASGYMAGPRILVTAAHCVMNIDNNDSYFSDWVAYPGYSDGNSYKGLSSGWSKIYYSPNWLSSHATEYDWCICILNSDIGNTTGWLGSGIYNTNSEMNNVSVDLFGYPGDFGGGERQCFSHGIISNTQDRYFDCTSRSTYGFSGGPFIRPSDNYAVGICEGNRISNPSISVGVRISQEMVNIISANM